MPGKYSAEQYDTRVGMILGHACELRLLLACTPASVLNGNATEHVLRRMVDEKLLEAGPRSLPAGLSYYASKTTS